MRVLNKSLERSSQLRDLLNYPTGLWRKIMGNSHPYQQKNQGFECPELSQARLSIFSVAGANMDTQDRLGPRSVERVTISALHPQTLTLGISSIIREFFLKISCTRFQMYAEYSYSILGCFPTHPECLIP